MSAAKPHAQQYIWKRRKDKHLWPFLTCLRIPETRLSDCPQVLECALVRAQYCRPFRLLQAAQVQITTHCVLLHLGSVRGCRGAFGQ